MIQLARPLARHDYRPTREVTYDPTMLDHLLRWQAEDPELGAHVVELIEVAIENPRAMIGRPKRVGGFPGVWSARISRAHRLFFIVTDHELRFLSCYGHDLPQSLKRELREEADG